MDLDEVTMFKGYARKRLEFKFKALVRKLSSYRVKAIGKPRVRRVVLVIILC